MTLGLAWLAVALATGALAHRWRHNTLRLCALVVCAAAALILAVAFTGDYLPGLLSRAATIFTATTVLTIFATLLVVRGLPQLVSRHDRHAVALVCIVMAGLYLMAGAFLAAASHDETRAQGLPQLRTRDEFIRWRDSPIDPGGVLLEAKVSDAMAELGPPHDAGVVASYRCVAVGPLRWSGSGQQLPARYLLDFPGGPPVLAAGIDSGNQAWAWHSPPECVLRRGDPVVVWGNLQIGMGGDGPTSSTGLADVRMIAAGDMRSFLDGYLPVAERTGRAVLALAALNGLLALSMVIVGIRAHRRLSRGDETPPRITWRSTPPHRP
ncbi:MAG: hypothetical protein WA965_15160 [Mycobacterium sp.]